MRTDGSHICDMSGAACRDWKRAVATADIHSSRESPVSLDAAGRHVITDAKIPEVLGSHRAVPGRQRGDALQTAVSYMRETANIPGQRRRSRTCSATGAWGGSPLARDERVELRGARRTPPDPEGPPGARGTTRDGCVVARRQAGTFAGGRRDKAVDCSPSPPAAAGLRGSEGEVRPSDPLTSLVFSPTAASTPRSANGAGGAPLADRSIDPPTHGRLCAATLLPARSSQEGQGFKDGSGEAMELQYYGTMRVQCVGTTFIVRYKSLAL